MLVFWRLVPFPFCCLIISMCLPTSALTIKVAQWLETVIRTVCGRRLLHVHVTGTTPAAEAKPERSQLPPSLPPRSALHLQPSPRKSVALYASDTLTNSLLISCVCVWCNETGGGTHITLSSYSPQCTRQNWKHWELPHYTVFDKQTPHTSTLWINMRIKLSIHFHILENKTRGHFKRHH